MYGLASTIASATMRSMASDTGWWYTLHKRAYHHPVSDAIDLMVAEAIVLANPYILVPGH